MSIGPIEAAGEYWVSEAERRLQESRRQLQRHTEQGRAQPVIVSDHLRVQADRLAVAAAEKTAQSRMEEAAAQEERRQEALTSGGQVDMLA